MTDSSLTNVRVRPDDTLHEVLQKIQNNGHGICVVTDDKDHVLGTITDGDCRRALLRSHGDLTTHAKEIMNTQFIVVDESFSLEHITALMRSNSVRQIPIVGNERQLINVVSCRSLEEHLAARPNKALILAGGKGTRLLPLTKTLPKPMLHVGGKPMLHQLLQDLVRYGYTDITLAVSYLSHIIEGYFGNGESFGCRISYIREESELGTAGPLSLLEHNGEDPILVMNGDLVTSVDFGACMDFHMKNHLDLTVAASSYEVQIPYGVLEVSDDYTIQGVLEKPKHQYPINAGVYVISPEVVRNIPQNTFYPMTDLINDSLAKGLKVGAFAIHENWEDISPQDSFRYASKQSITRS